MRGSMSRKGDCWDNAVTETLFGSLKVERLAGLRFPTRRAAKDEIMSWLTFYNHRRLHSTLGYLSPMAFEKIRLLKQVKPQHDLFALGDVFRGQGHRDGPGAPVRQTVRPWSLRYGKTRFRMTAIR